MIDARDEIKNLLLKPCSHKPVHDWVKEKENKGIQWNAHLIEALTIIQDYRILKTQFGKYNLIADS